MPDKVVGVTATEAGRAGRLRRRDRRARPRGRRATSSSPASEPRRPSTPSRCSARQRDRRAVGEGGEELAAAGVELTVARSSPRVGPRLTITTGTPALAARRTNRKPLITVSDEPTTSSASSGGERVDRVVAPLDAGGRDVLAEEHDVGLEHARRSRRSRGRRSPAVSSRSTSPSGRVARRACASAKPGLASRQAFLEPRPARRTPAGEADDVGDPAVQRDQAARPGGLVEPVDVLGDQQVGVDRGERAVAGVGLGPTASGRKPRWLRAQ